MPLRHDEKTNQKTTKVYIYAVSTAQRINYEKRIVNSPHPLKQNQFPGAKIASKYFSAARNQILQNLRQSNT